MLKELKKIEKNDKIYKKTKQTWKKYFVWRINKGNTLLQYYNLSNKDIPFAAERSPEKWNKYTVGSE